MTRSQLDLFGDEGVGPAAIGAEIETLASELPPEIRLGTSSWSFPGWQGIVYDRRAPKPLLARAGLAAYARHPLLRTVSLDRSYYAPLSTEAFRDYAAAVPAHFRFMVKAHRDLTTERGGNPRYLDSVYASEEVVAPFVEGLGERAGPLVFQFPPRRDRKLAEAFAAELFTFLSGLPPGPLYAVEIRHSDWLRSDLAVALRDAGAVPCFTVHPTMPGIRRQRDVLEAAAARRAWVVRWMLGGGLDYEDARDRYTPFDRLAAPDAGARQQIARLCRDAARARQPAFVAINNKAEGSGPLSAIELARAIAEAE